MKLRWMLILFLLSGFFDTIAIATEPDETARPIPATRPEMKQLLEDMKSRKVRLPLPELTATEKEQLGERADDYESRLRYHYLIANEGSAFGTRPPATGSAATSSAAAPTAPTTRDFRRNADQNMTLSYEFKTELFWIVSRTNNCQYCLGHQEQKLSAAGLSEERIAALDLEWDSFTPAEQAAYAWARKLTWSPNAISDADIETLRKHYTDLQILEMTLSVAGNNAINRWKEGTGVAQSQHGTRFFENASTTAPKETLPIDSFLTPTTGKYQKKRSVVAALAPDANGTSTRAVVGVPPINETRAEVEAQLAAMSKRQSRLPLVSSEATRVAFSKSVEGNMIPAWMRLMANFPNESLRRIDSLIERQVGVDDLSALDRARVSWVVARQDRAWYAVGHAMKRLQELGQSAEQVYALDGDLKSLSETERAILVMARKLATSPITLADEDVANVVKLSGPRRATQLINYVTSRAYFDRVTEAAGLSTSEDQLLK
jgi:alkylhydroperoxidase family enzyme